MNARMLFILRGFAALLLISLPAFAQAATLNVPSYSYPTIQSGIAAAQNGDTVLVADGIYTGDGNRDIDFYGKNITVISQNGAAKTIIDCQGSSSSPHRGFYIHSGELKAAISGFTVKNGYEYGTGGGIDDENFIGGTININDCTIIGNTAQYSGGGISSSNSGGTITLNNCTVSGNTSNGNGGGVSNSNYVNLNYPASISHSGTIILTHCTLAGNSASGQGGGIYNSNDAEYAPSNRSDSITLTDCAITKNTAQSSGGGVSNSNNGGTVALTRCTIAGNTTLVYGTGGGLYNANFDYRTSAVDTITLTDCTVTGNSASVQGGGIYNSNPGFYGSSQNNEITLTNCSVVKNTAQYGGGGIFNVNGNNNSILLTACTVTGNIVTGQKGTGGGIFNNGGGTITVSKCEITANSAASGGGVYSENDSAGLISLTACTIDGNTAQYSGGGVYNINSSGGTITLTNCTITRNAVNGQYGAGGGAYNYNINYTGGVTITLTNCTLTRNTAAFGAGLGDNDFQNGLLVLTNDIIYANAGTQIQNLSYQGSSPSVINCDIQGGYPGTSDIDADPLFFNAPAGDVHLNPGSPCLGAGTANGAPIVDKDNQFRPNQPSIGAYELKVPPATITSFVLSSDSIDAPGTKLSAFVTASGIFSKITVSVPRSNLSIVSPTFTLINYGGSPYWYGTIPTAFLKLAKINPVTFVATGTRADGTTATLTTTLQINNLPALTVYIYPDTAIVNRNGNFNLFAFAGNFSGRPALYTTVQITLPPGIDYISAPGFTYNASSRTLTQGVPSLNFQPFNLVFRASATASTQTPLTLSIMASCPGFQNVTQNETILVVP